jgi:TRAP-type C4-dicarboxylate transport system substrate-binding protein
MTLLRTVLLMALALSIAACGRAPAPGPVVLVYATPYSPEHPFSRADREWMDFIEKRSGGTLRIRPSWQGALLSSEHSLIELRHGVADVGLITPIYVKGGAHLIRVQSGFYSGADTIESQVALYRCLSRSDAQFDRELSGLKVLAVQGGILPGIVTRDRPVHQLQDLRGLRIRAPTELLGVLHDLGADPVNMPMGDVYSALAKGVIDGVVAPIDTFRSLHFAEVARWYTALSVPRGAYPARAMALRRWNALSIEHRQVLEEGIAVWEAALARQTRRSQIEGLAAARAGGVKELQVEPADQQRFDALYVADARREAERLKRFGIDGVSVFESARRCAGEAR